MSQRHTRGCARGLVKGICSVILIGLTAATASGDERDSVHVLAPKRPARPDDTFTRMFPGLPPFAPATDDARDQAKKLGEKGGVLDALDLLSDPIQSILNPAVFSPHNPDNPNMTAGVTFFGQFLDHDVTLDLKSPLQEPSDPRRTTNFRTAAFDLDSLYGDGPQESPELYDASSGDAKFRVDVIPGSEKVSRKGAVRYDLPRDENNNAVIGDSRNDENVIISQFHVAMLRFHNAVIEHLRAKPEFARASSERVFRAAQRLVRWHYQWIILHEFLPLTIGDERVAEILSRGPRFFNVDDPQSSQRFRNARRDIMIPIEFSVAAYRFGHSQVRPSYRLNFGPDGGRPSLRSSSTIRSIRTNPIRAICGAGNALRDGSSTGRPSSTSATGMPGRTSGSIASSLQF